ncbi:MAG: leucine-rich repeat domain-containing protein, partial [Thermoguttaceae bacterium]|nr:leucine-rich repeat domain-containing protein [Thermoguttaceae bacterium]
MRFHRRLFLLNALALRVFLVALGVWTLVVGVVVAQDTDEDGPIMKLTRNSEPIGDVSRSRTERLERYEVDPDNPDLRSVDGIVYSRDMKKLLAVPQKYPVKDVIIPTGVETIEEGAFSGCLLVESVSTPESLKEIGDLAFAECRSLRSVVLSEGVVTIGSSAFEACCALTSVQAPKSLKTIGSKAFFDCTTLESVFIPEGVRSIGSNAFFRCYSLASFDVAEGNERYKSVDGVLFSKGGKTLLNYPIASKRKSYSIPAGVETIGEDAFWHCATLETVYLPESVKKIGPSGFCYCLGLKTIYLPEAIEEIGRMAFSMCPSLGEIAVPRKVEKIADYAFKDCSSLRFAELSENVKSIGEMAFYGCKSLTIIAPQGSFAEQYANENDVQFESHVVPREV